jgi:uncharacterized protein (TIGR04255 family)
MNTSRANAPLVELIAELRWEPINSGGVSVPTPGSGLTFISGPQSTAPDEFFMRFGAGIHQSGYTETERLVPPGFPFLQGQPVYRFKESREGSLRSLYQIGLGLFTANAVPPYETWTEFRPVVQTGVEALLAARAEGERDKPITLVNLRYIDAFEASHTEGRNIGQFLGEVLGLSVAVPDALSQHLRPDSIPKPSVQLQIPMNDGKLMTLSVAEGTANGRPAILMDTLVATTLPLPANIESIMEAFNAAHDAINSTFSKLIQPISHLMPRVQKESI